MWYSWSALLLVCCALVTADVTVTGTEAPAPLATTVPPPRRTLDRKAAELAWKSWLQSPESGSQNAPARRITTKSLFITPLVCPKGQRLDRNGCVQLVTVNKDEHERNLLEQLNALFTAPPSGDELYDYGDQEAGPLQLSIPIGLDPQAAPLQGQEPAAQAPNLQPNGVKVDKKDGNATDASIEAELELLKLQNSLRHNNSGAFENSNMFNGNLLINFHNADKPKRDSTGGLSAEVINNNTDEGQKELVFGHVSVDPVVFNSENETASSEKSVELLKSQDVATTDKVVENMTNITLPDVQKENKSDTTNSSTHAIKPDEYQNKLKPENDYGDIGEAIKLISRYADVTTDDNFAKERNKSPEREDSVLGTRTKLQYRRNKPKEQEMSGPPAQLQLGMTSNERGATHNVNTKPGPYYRYPWQSQHSPKPPADYPFRHLQDYWPGRNQAGGVYNAHENPRRHHHSYPHNFRLHGYPHAGDMPVAPEYPEQVRNYIRRAIQRHANQLRPDSNPQDLYSLLDLRHWFSSEGTSNR